VLLHQLAPNVSRLPEPDLDRIVIARHAIDCAKVLGVAIFTRPNDLCKNNSRLIMGFAAQIFNTLPALEAPVDIQLCGDIPVVPSLQDVSPRALRQHKSFSSRKESFSMMNGLQSSLGMDQISLEIPLVEEHQHDDMIKFEVLGFKRIDSQFSSRKESFTMMNGLSSPVASDSYDIPHIEEHQYDETIGVEVPGYKRTDSKFSSRKESFTMMNGLHSPTTIHSSLKDANYQHDEIIVVDVPGHKRRDSQFASNKEAFVAMSGLASYVQSANEAEDKSHHTCNDTLTITVEPEVETAVPVTDNNSSKSTRRTSSKFAIPVNSNEVEIIETKYLGGLIKIKSARRSIKL
jgi:hypothetical protein